MQQLQKRQNDERAIEGRASAAAAAAAATALDDDADTAQLPQPTDQNEHRADAAPALEPNAIVGPDSADAGVDSAGEEEDEQEDGGATSTAGSSASALHAALHAQLHMVHDPTALTTTTTTTTTTTRRADPTSSSTLDEGGGGGGDSTRKRSASSASAAAEAAATTRLPRRLGPAAGTGTALSAAQPALSGWIAPPTQTDTEGHAANVLMVDPRLRRDREAWLRELSWERFARDGRWPTAIIFGHFPNLAGA